MLELPPVNPDTHFRLVATSDWQIGMVGGSFGPQSAKLLRDTRIETIERILTTAEDVGAQAVLAAGDLFEFPDQPKETAGRVAKILQRHRDIPIHAIPGNHDLYGPGTIWTKPELHGIGHLTVHPGDDPAALAEGVTLWPLPVLSKHDINPQHDRLSPVTDEPGVHIVMAHGHDTSYLDLQHEDCKLPIASGAVVEMGYSLLILGHWHSWNPISERVLYPGTHEQTKFGERDAGYIAIVDVPLDGSAPTVHRHRSGTLRWHREAFDCTGRTLPDDLVQHLGDLSADIDFLELTLTGDVHLNDSLAALPQARAAIEPMVEHLSWVDETRELVDLDTAIAQYALPQGLRQVQEALLVELQRAGDDHELMGALRAELEVLYEVARDVGAIGVEGSS